MLRILCETRKGCFQEQICPIIKKIITLNVIYCGFLKFLKTIPNQEIKSQQLVRMCGRTNLCLLLVGVEPSAAIMEVSIGVSRKNNVALPYGPVICTSMFISAVCSSQDMGAT